MRMLTLALRLLLVLALALVSGHQAVGRALASGALAVELCRDGSLVTVTLDASGKPVAQDHACPDCVLAGLALAADPPALAAPTRRALPVGAPAARPAPCGQAAPCPAARGPPAPMSA